MQNNHSAKIFMRSRKKQAGITLMGGIIVALIGGFFAYLAMLLFPVVININTMDTILRGVNNEPGVMQMSNKEIVTLINKRLRINDIRDVTTEDFEIVRENGVITVYLDFDNKIEFAKDIYILIENHKSVDLTGQGQLAN